MKNRLSVITEFLWRVNQPLQLVSAAITVAGVIYAVVSRQPLVALSFVSFFLLIYSAVVTHALLGVAPVFPLIGALGDLREELNECTVQIDMESRRYHLTFHKAVTNVSAHAVERVMYWVFANRFPDDPQQSYAFYQAHPLSWADLNLLAWDQHGRLDVLLVNDLNARKDFCICFQQDGVPRAMTPGETRDVRYSYSVPFEKWGPYIDRPMLYRTRTCSVSIQVPAASDIQVGGLEISPLRRPRAIDQPIVRTLLGNIVQWNWTCRSPALGSTYRIVWSDVNANPQGQLTHSVGEEQV